MKKLDPTLILLFCCLFPIFSKGQDAQKCNSTILTHISVNLDKPLKEDDILQFLLTFGSACKNNVEYSEWSNELLFEVLKKHTKATIHALNSGKGKIDKNYILKELRAPLHDQFDIGEIIKKVERVSDAPDIQREVIDALRIAGGVNK
jgi:hypothetical protein